MTSIIILSRPEMGDEASSILSKKSQRRVVALREARNVLIGVRTGFSSTSVVPADVLLIADYILTGETDD